MTPTRTKKIIRIFSRIKVIAVPFDILEMDNHMEERTICQVEIDEQQQYCLRSTGGEGGTDQLEYSCRDGGRVPRALPQKAALREG